MDTVRGILSNRSSRRESRRNSPHSSRAASVENPNQDDIIINQDQLEDLYPLELVAKEAIEPEREKTSEIKQVQKACNECNISHVLGQCPGDEEDAMPYPKAPPFEEMQDCNPQQVR